jgi:hypothetical protein
MPEDRWDRLSADLKAAGIDCTLYRRTGQYGCGPKAEITITEGDRKVVISDKWWNKNIDVWVGWQVFAEDHEGITLGRPSRWTKKRSETVANVRTALAALETA